MRVVAIFSGGMDSTTMLYQLLAEGHEVKAIGFDYGQRHAVELKAAKAIAARSQVAYETVDLQSLGPIIAGQSSQVNPNVEVPDGHYSEDSMKATVVPNRNMIMLAVAVAHAISIDYDAICYGAHAGDHTIYPDCRAEFVEAMKTSIGLCDWKKITLLTPFVDISKADIAAIGGRISVPFEMTWSCYKGGTTHCGTCGTCVERREAFELAGILDPTGYSASTS
ncbi:MAG: 7-cyano-7-deazaguanine synthase QueC [Myxococcales bacterium]|nr:7-cyano-7-deazaguanine synthase QueC [Myxococcales bacterium]